MVAWKSLAAFAIVVAGAVAAFAVYTFGGRENGEHPTKTRASHIYTLRRGDVIRVPTASTKCEVSAEGGFPNLFCTRTPAGRFEFVFYKDSVIVWGSGGPDKATASYRWQPNTGAK